MNSLGPFFHTPSLETRLRSAHENTGATYTVDAASSNSPRTYGIGPGYLQLISILSHRGGFLVIGK